MVNDLSVSITGALDRISPAMDDLSDAAGKLAELAEKLGPVMDRLAEASGDGRQLADDLGQAMESLQTALDQLRRSANDGANMSSALQDAFRQLGDLSDDAGEAARLLSASVDKIKDAVDYLRQTGPVTLTPVDDAYRAAGDRLFDDLTGMSAAMNALNNSTTSASDTLLADLRAINRQFNVLTDLVTDALTDLRDGMEDGPFHWVQDTSAENAVAQTQGKVDHCTNSGLVEGDRDVGGIPGSMAIEYALNPEDDGTLNLSLGAAYEMKSVVLSCVNQGGVIGKKDCVGGVVGRMDLGFLSACQNYGDVESTSGGYVGGIAGCGGTVRGCAAICLISDAAECLGAVAGYADNLEDITENYYIDTGLGGVDGISYAGHAQSAELSFLQTLEGVPFEFTSFRLILRSDGRVIQTIPFTFWQRLSQIELPAPPEKEGCFGIWPTPEDDTPRSDVILDVEYFPWLTVISSQQADGDRSLALADGQFTSQAVLAVADSARSAPAGASAKANVWDVTLTGTDLGGGAVLSLRLLCPGGGTVRAYWNGGWQTLDVQVNGS